MRTDAAPGSVVRVEVDRGELPRGSPAASTHAFGLAETVELARTLGRLPARMILWGIAGVRFGMGEDSSPVVRAAVPGVARGVLADLEGLGPAGGNETERGGERCTSDA